MGSYQGQATLVLADGTAVDGQAEVRTSKRSWTGTVVVGPEEHERAGEVTRIELPTGESRAVAVSGSQPDEGRGTYVVSFASTD